MFKQFFRRARRAFHVSRTIVFGRYICSGWDGERSYVAYELNGIEYRVPDTFN